MASNKTIATILIVSMVIALFGMVISLNRIEGITRLAALTGAWTEGSTTYGAVNLTISSQMKINFTDDTANFGTGYVRSGTAACTVGTDGTNTTGSCIGFSVPNGLLLENTGNVEGQVNISNVNYTESFFQGAGVATAGYAIKWETPESTSDYNVTCSVQNTTGRGPWVAANMIITDFAYGTWKNTTSAAYFGEVGATGTGLRLCERLNASDASDTVNFSFKFEIPNNVYSNGDVRDLFTATISAVA